ncbi:MAG TPA: hypothetical protein PKK14_05860, partial [Pseudomonadales bacterium]|nr:hypothetical protein [Pseudomonadales bacterium]
MLGKLFGFNKKQPTTAPTVPTPTPTPVEKKHNKPTLQTLASVQSVDDIHDIQQLQQLLKQSAALDKKTNQLLRDRLHSLKATEQQRQQPHEAQEKLCQKLETLAKL